MTPHAADPRAEHAKGFLGRLGSILFLVRIRIGVTNLLKKKNSARLGIGCFGELSAGFNDVCTFIARNRAVSYMDRYD